MNSSKIQQDYNGDFQLVPMEYIFDWNKIGTIVLGEIGEKGPKL